MISGEGMTNEEAIKNIKEHCYFASLIPQAKEALDMAIKALEQQPITWIVGKDNCQVAVRDMSIDKIQKICAIIGEEEQESCEDCISREAIDDYIAKLMSGYLYDEERTRLEEFSAYLWELPSVTPQPKTGRWIPDDTICEDTLYRCSNCDNVYYSDYGDVKDMGYNYCPNCGCQMLEGR